MLTCSINHQRVFITWYVLPGMYYLVNDDAYNRLHESERVENASRRAAHSHRLLIIMLLPLSPPS